MNTARCSICKEVILSSDSSPSGWIHESAAHHNHEAHALCGLSIEDWAGDWFSRSPKYRTKADLAQWLGFFLEHSDSILQRENEMLRKLTGNEDGVIAEFRWTDSKDGQHLTGCLDEGHDPKTTKCCLLAEEAWEDARKRMEIAMGYGYSADGGRWGFCSVADWLESVILSFPAPWKVRGNEGKHYGTEIEDARGHCILSVWFAFGDPSAREKGTMTDEEWAEYCCDSHWESADQLRIAETIVSLRNYIASCEKSYHADERAAPMLRSLILEHGNWNEDIDDEIKCGGPQRRETAGEHDTRDPRGYSSWYREWLAERKKHVCPNCGELRTALQPKKY